MPVPTDTYAFLVGIVITQSVFARIDGSVAYSFSTASCISIALTASIGRANQSGHNCVAVAD